MTPIYAEVHRWTAKPHDWGVSDCMLVLADWVRNVSGIDPAAALRGTYCDEVTCEQVTGFLRDPLTVSTACFEGVAGLQRGNELKPGDVGVIRRKDAARWPLGGLWLGDCWACKGPEGTTTLHPDLVEVLAFWNVGYAA